MPAAEIKSKKDPNVAVNWQENSGQREKQQKKKLRPPPPPLRLRKKAGDAVELTVEDSEELSKIGIRNKEQIKELRDASERISGLIGGNDFIRARFGAIFISPTGALYCKNDEEDDSNKTSE